MLFLCMVTVWVSNVAMHPALHSFPMDMSELCVRPGKMCASNAALGNCGRASVHLVLVDCRQVPFGSPTMMGILVDPSVSCGSLRQM